MTSTAMMTKRGGFLFMAMGLLAGLVLATIWGGGTAKADSHATGFEEVRTDVTQVQFTPKKSREGAEVWFTGSGFVPGTEIVILISDSNGVLTDITIPAGKRKDGGGSVANLAANADGAWATEWRIGRFSRKGVGGEGMFSVLIMDQDFNTLTTTPLALCNLSRNAKLAEGAEAADVPNYCES
jgi:hypothetical protein